MQDGNTGRVVVSVDDSLAGLRALRAAVELARCRGAEVRAVRTYRLPPGSRGGWIVGLDAPSACAYATEDELTAVKRDAAAAVVRAFGQAMGGVPRDVVVHVKPANEPLHGVLVATACQEDDLLVVAEKRRPHRWFVRRSLARRCLARAVCPVLVVPAPQAARELGGPWSPWRRLRRRRELAALLGDSEV